MTTAPFPSENPAPASARRTHAYLRLCGLEPAASGELAGQPVEKIQDDLEAWAAALGLVAAGEGAVRQKAHARAQMLLASVPARWPGHFLQIPPPAELADAAQAVILQPTRPLRQTNMAPEPIDLGPVSEVAQETWRTFDTWPVLRGLTIWLLFTLLLGAVFYVVRF